MRESVDRSSWSRETNRAASYDGTKLETRQRGIGIYLNETCPQADRRSKDETVASDRPGLVGSPCNVHRATATEVPWCWLLLAHAMSCLVSLLLSAGAPYFELHNTYQQLLLPHQRTRQQDEHCWCSTSTKFVAQRNNEQFVAIAVYSYQSHSFSTVELGPVKVCPVNCQAAQAGWSFPKLAVVAS